MKTLEDATIEELKAEIKRKKKLDSPKVKDNINWQPVVDTLEDYKKKVLERQYSYNCWEDTKEDIVDEVLKAVYGSGVLTTWMIKV